MLASAALMFSIHQPPTFEDDTIDIFGYSHPAYRLNYYCDMITKILRRNTAPCRLRALSMFAVFIIYSYHHNTDFQER